MADGAASDVLGQKAQAAQRAFEARGMSAAKALRRALSRTADVLWDLALVCQNVSQEQLDQDGVISCLTNDDLLLLLDGPDGALGLVAISRAVMTGVIEVQTIAQVTTMPPEERPLTQTDAAMMAPLVDGMLRRFIDNLDGHPLVAQFDGYRFGAMIEDPRAASLLLEASDYRSFEVDIDLALGRRKGPLRLILPERELRQSAQASEQGNASEPGPHSETMERLPVRLDAVLARIALPLRQAQALKPGDLLPLPGKTLEEVHLRAGKGQVIAKGKLGQMDAMRAVRLTWPEAKRAQTPDGVPAPLDETPAMMAAPALDALPDVPDQQAEPDVALPDLPELPDLPAGDFAEADALPDLPPLDFEMPEGSFDEETADQEFTELADLPMDFDTELSEL